MATIRLYHGASSEFGKVSDKLFTFFTPDIEVATSYARASIESGIECANNEYFIYYTDVEESLFVDYDFEEFDAIVKEGDAHEYSKCEESNYYCILGRNLSINLLDRFDF